METISGSIKNEIGLDINYEINFSIRQQQPIFLFLHGFKAFRNWGFYPYLCFKMAESGFIAIRFDFSMAGVIDGDKLIYNPEIFSQNTIAREISDAKIFIEHIENQKVNFDYDLWNGEIILCGHSRGAAISILIANNFDSVKKLILLSPISTFDRYSERQKEIWKRNGYVEFKLVHSQQKLKMNYSYLLDLLNNAEQYNLQKAISKIKKPIQIIHGRQDLTVSIKEAYELAHNVLNKNLLRLIVIDRAGHGFNVEHPFKVTNPVLDEMVSAIISFAKE